jgi:redox-sensitive bicupin YhaK (pirin superfamily)
LIRVIMGSAYTLQSPVLTYSPTLYFEVTLPAGGKLVLLDEAPERAVYVVAGRVTVGGQPYGEGTLAVLRPGTAVPLAAETDARAIVVGGASIGPRHIWWNFVSSSEARIERAKRDWAEMRMGSVPGDDEFIPLPE